jgi:hypothetical protein
MTARNEVRWLLDAVSPDGAPPPHPAPEDQAAVLRLARRHRLAALLASRAGALGLAPGIIEELRVHAAATAARNLAFTGEMLRIIQAGQSAGIAFTPFKGPLLAVEAYGDLSLREFDDLDLLAAREDLPAAASLLESLGYGLMPGVGRASDAVRLRSEYHFPFQHAESGCCVELHAEVAPAGFAKPLWRDLRRRLSPTELAGVRLEALSPADLLVVLCIHAGKHQWGCLEFVTALAHLVRRRPPDWEQVERVARASGAEGFAGLGLRLARDWMNAAVPDHLACRADIDPSIPDRWVNPPSAPALLRRVAFHMRCHSRWQYKARYLAAALFAPNWDDYVWCPLPRRLQFCYPAVRCTRLALTQATALLGLRRAESATHRS